MPLLGFNVFSVQNLNWKTRMFAPATAIDEYLAAGCAVGPLAIHLACHRRIAWYTEIRISQGEKIGNPGKLCARVREDMEHFERIQVSDFVAPVGGGWVDSNLFGWRTCF